MTLKEKILKELKANDEGLSNFDYRTLNWLLQEIEQQEKENGNFTCLGCQKDTENHFYFICPKCFQHYLELKEKE